jgi:hypothetical protein
MPDVVIEQALYRRDGEKAPVLLARSPGFADSWLAEAEQLLTAFGERPPGAACPSAVFAHPFGKVHVAIVQAVEQGSAGLGFHILIVPRPEYTKYLGDPFLLSERLPPAWEAHGELPALSWPAEPLPRRTVDEVQAVLRRLKSGALCEDEEIPEEQIERTVENSEGPALLGGVQALIDGGQVVFERPGPDTRLMRGLWTLLPTSTRTHLWPASFAFSNELHFDAVIVRRARPDDYPGYLTEDQAADYPEGRYERRLQAAAEEGDQGELDALLGRRSPRETWRLGLTILILFMVLALASRLLVPGRPETEPESARQRQAEIVAGIIGIGRPLETAMTYTAARETLKKLETPEQAGPLAK